ncbi:MAG: VWA domain-containing protein [Myxococcota bacterium]
MSKQSSRSPHLTRGAITAAVLLVATVAAASSYQHFAPAAGGQMFEVKSSSNAPVKLSARLDRNRILQGGDGTVRMELTLTGAERASDGPDMPTDLFVVLDRSGSMTGEKLQRAKAAARGLIAQLSPIDRFSLVSYESGTRMEIPLSNADHRAREHWLAVIDRLETAGGTNMSAGLDLAHEHLVQKRRPNRATRVVLISDGQANEGDPSVPGLTRRARRAAQAEYVLSTVGVGLDFNEQLMTTLANVGTGNFYFVENATHLAKVFHDEFDSARATIASALSVQLATPRGVTVRDAAGYVLERDGDTTIFRPGSLFAGQQRRIWIEYHIAGNQLGELRLGSVDARYRDRGERQQVSLASLPAIARVQDRDAYIAGIDSDVWGEGIAVDRFNDLRERVSEAVKRGDKGSAMQAVADYQAEHEELNDVVQSPAVSKSMRDSVALEAEIAEAFSGSGQAEKRNRTAKSLKSRGFDGRRAGSKK